MRLKVYEKFKMILIQFIKFELLYYAVKCGIPEYIPLHVIAYTVTSGSIGLNNVWHEYGHADRKLC